MKSIRTACVSRLLLLVLLLTLPAVVQAQFKFETNNGALTITGYTGPGGAVIIPSTTNGLPVTSIWWAAFFYTSLTSVTIPDSVTTIEDGAFSHCASLTAITVNALNSFYSSVDGVLFNKSTNTLIQCPGDKAGNYTIPASVKNIVHWAFNSCTSLSSVTIPNSVISIGGGAFSYCTNLTAITVNALNSFYSSVDGVLFDKGTNTLIQCPGGKAGNYTIPASVTSIGSSAFSSCYGLTSVTIGNGVTSIGNNVFSECTSLSNVTIGNSVTSIGDWAFAGCTSLSAIIVDALNSAYSSTNGVLFNKSQTTLIQCPDAKAGSYTIPNSVTSIGNNAFSECSTLTSVTIPSAVTNIGSFAFYYCSSLTSITIPDSVTNIGEGAFVSCTSLSSVTIGNRVTSIRRSAFNSCTSLSSVTIGNSVTSIGDLAFVVCTSLTSVTIPNSVTSIGNSAFDSCTSLSTVTIGDSVTSIGGWAFADCTSLTGVYYQGNAPSLGSSVFDGADNATVYYLPGTAGWDQWVGPPPAVLWNPHAQNLGVRTNQFGFTITGTTNIPILVDACTNLASSVWISLKNCTLTNGSVYFSDPQWTNHPARFYRLRWP